MKKPTKEAEQYDPFKSCYEPPYIKLLADCKNVLTDLRSFGIHADDLIARIDEVLKNN